MLKDKSFKCVLCEKLKSANVGVFASEMTKTPGHPDINTLNTLLFCLMILFNDSSKETQSSNNRPGRFSIVSVYFESHGEDVRLPPGRRQRGGGGVRLGWSNLHHWPQSHRRAVPVRRERQRLLCGWGIRRLNPNFLKYQVTRSPEWLTPNLFCAVDDISIHNGRTGLRAFAQIM